MRPSTRVPSPRACSAAQASLERVVALASSLEPADQPKLERALLNRPLTARHPSVLVSLREEEGAAADLLWGLLEPLLVSLLIRRKRVADALLAHARAAWAPRAD